MKRQILMVLALAMFGSACNSKTSPTTFTPVPTGPNTVLVANTTAGFAPPTLTVSVGTTVTWGNNDGSTTHTSTSDSGLWDSSTFSAGQTFTRRFDAAGSFKYHCTVHPTMTGTVVVQ